MSLTKAQLREILSKAGVDAEHMSEAVDNIIEGHKASIDALREDRDKYKEDAEKLPDIQKELDNLKAKANENQADPFEPKYNELKTEYENYKAGVEAKETEAKKKAAYREFLKETGIAEKRLDTVLKASVSEISAIELTEDGKIKDADTRAEAVKKEWADFIATEGTEGAKTPTPPDNTGGSSKVPSRAAQIAQKYREQHYGKEEN